MGTNGLEEGQRERGREEGAREGEPLAVCLGRTSWRKSCLRPLVSGEGPRRGAPVGSSHVWTLAKLGETVSRRSGKQQDLGRDWTEKARQTEEPDSSWAGPVQSPGSSCPGTPPAAPRLQGRPRRDEPAWLGSSLCRVPLLLPLPRPHSLMPLQGSRSGRFIGFIGFIAGSRGCRWQGGARANPVPGFIRTTLSRPHSF